MSCFAVSIADFSVEIKIIVKHVLIQRIFLVLSNKNRQIEAIKEPEKAETIRQRLDPPVMLENHVDRQQWAHN